MSFPKASLFGDYCNHKKIGEMVTEEKQGYGEGVNSNLWLILNLFHHVIVIAYFWIKVTNWANAV